MENENLGLAPKQFWLWGDLSALSALITGSYFNLLLVSTGCCKLRTAHILAERHSTLCWLV